ncbi:hercynine oxygenase-like [Physella acuta]|uniref:hercynine oxygenase-like n=1 Tax=Physella acuta TaxID=109671 RepID=UPI0027DBA5A7|nr:hercynine oxygenase-like [Physella acuta]
MDVLTGKKVFSSLTPIDLSSCTKEKIIEYFNNSYDLNESIFLGLKDDSVFYKCPDRLRLPLIFYYAHTAAVYVNKLMLAGLIKERVNLEFETMFETGVDEMSWDDTENYRMGGSYKWPPVSEVVEYRRVVRNLILKVIDETTLELPITMDSPWWALMMGMEHERIHLETSSVLIRQLPIELVVRPEGWRYGPVKSDCAVKKNKMITAASMEVTLGKPTEFPSYGWDNEYGEVTCKVPPFEASQFLITNAEFLKFVEDGGYQTRDFWTEEGWKWVQFREAVHPTFWTCNQGCKSGCGSDLASYSHCQGNYELSDEINDGPLHKKPKHSVYQLRVMFDLIEMPWDWPVEVNYHEAKAFCKWKGPGYRLPVEAEHHVMRGPQLPASKGTASDIIFQKTINANLNFQYGSSTPVNLFPPSNTGFYDVFGNVWEWVEDHFNGLTGFHTHFLYDDFSSPCFDGKHNIILGGSWISTGDEASRFARYAFRRHFFQHCGFRLAKSQQSGKVDLPARVVENEVFVLGSGVEANKIYLDNNLSVQRVKSTNAVYNYDTLETLEGILELEFGFRDSFAAVVSNLCRNYCTNFQVPTKSAVHLGTATGRGSFELSKLFQQVLGVEMCGRLIDAAIRLQSGRCLTFKDGKNIKLDEYKMERIIFKQLTWVPNEIESHDLVLITHLDRVQNPKAWLIRLWEITKPHGVAVIASKDGSWNRERLEHHLHHRLKCVSTDEVQYEDRSGKGIATVTAWMYK